MQLVSITSTVTVESSNLAPGDVYSIHYVIKFASDLQNGRWFSPVSSINKTDRHDIAEILLKLVLNMITPSVKPSAFHFKHVTYYCPRSDFPY